MFKLPFRALRRFDKDQRGNVAVLFAFSMVPLIGLLGGAVDVARHQRYKVEIANAMDAAAIALVRRGAKNDAEADDFRQQLRDGDAAGRRPGQDAPHGALRRHQISGGYRVVGHGTMDTAFLPVVGIEEMTLDLSTEVQTTGGKYEIALALDNTGSMRSTAASGRSATPPPISSTTSTRATAPRTA